MIKRYRPIDYEMEEDETGEWVKWEDAEQLIDALIDHLDYHGVLHPMSYYVKTPPPFRPDTSTDADPDRKKPQRE